MTKTLSDVTFGVFGCHPEITLNAPETVRISDKPSITAAGKCVDVDEAEAKLSALK